MFVIREQPFRSFRLKNLLLILALFFAAAPRLFYAAPQFETVEKSSYDEQRKAEYEKTAQSILGKTYWFEPNPKAISQLAFRESLPSVDKSSGYVINWFPPTFRPTGKVAFTDTNVHVFQPPKGRSLEYYAEITFEGQSKVGYLKIELPKLPPFTVYDPENNYGMEYKEVVYTEDPDVIRQRERKSQALKEQKRIAQAKAWKARGGVRLGMTKEQVLASNWRKPQRVNKTTKR